MKNALKMAAEFMALSARTAPKTAGKDYIEVKVIDDEAELVRLGEEMAAYGEKHGKRNYDRDGRGIASCGAVLLVAVKNAATAGLNCGACGYDDCTKLPKPHDGAEFAGPFCPWRFVDLGIAVGSAVKTASMLNVDNRIMYRIGVVARKMQLIEGDVVLGIPLSATGKNIFFDR
ncbi:conserved protein of unknown function [Tepidanaerobacter acetatoxydans Re1]|uniref:DUF2148 domain-containing protein n=1 Tax=Tepidanaerobacter acetatoxydans (strain DSM 21804 / JCM 16047 / Re1) TaxID=1209989 RepID=F4LRQ9_TEPAE|nr:DUF2148 domain-containing protein [Tepidanaerobacter acetatoxydans]AEE91127.1 Protein of unknown function DUF2148 [Tepidanaerobacter acetatoxydans Re1]CCP25792.1 conserved protein of unknown function [Tepidanaerobacter acetatoxydans Re1]